MAHGGSIVFGKLVRVSGIVVFRVDYCTFRNLECANFGVGSGGGYGYRETLGAFGRVETWRGRFAWVETSALCFRETSGCFSGDMET